MRVILFPLAAFATLLTTAQTAPPIEWQHSFGGSEAEFANSIQPTTDGGYIFAGGTSSSNGDVVGYHGGASDAWVVKLDAVGVVEWQRPIGGPGIDRANAVKQTSDGGFIVAGSSNANGGDVTGNHGNWDLWVFKLDVNGDLEWQKSYGGSNVDSGSSIEQINEGGYILAGLTKSSDGDVDGYHGNGDCWLVKIGGTGELLWQRALGGSAAEFGPPVTRQTDDDGYILISSTYSDDGDLTENHGDGDFWVVKTNAVGEIQWQRSLGGAFEEIGSSILQLADGGYIAAGYSLSNDGDVSGNHGSADHWVVKLDGAGVLQWQKSFGGSSVDWGLAIQQTSEGGYVLAGSTRSDDGQVTGFHGGQFDDAWVVRLDQYGELLWEKALGGSSTDRALDVQITDDGGYILVGLSGSNDGDLTNNHGSSDAWVVKLGPDDVGIAESEAAIPFTLYPNPATDAVTLHFDRVASAPVQVQLGDVAGRNVKADIEAAPINGEGDVRVNLGMFPAGIYELRVRNGGRWYAQRLVKL